MENGIVFLFGAGASKGAGHIEPYCPPLMNGLYDELAEFFDDEWGPGTQYGAYADRFRENFEESFSREVLTFGGGIPQKSSYAILRSQNLLALYFARFVLDSSGMDCYSTLLSSLNETGTIDQCLFGFRSTMTASSNKPHIS